MHKTPEITRLIHENFWIVISFAFAQPVVAKVIKANSKASGSTFTNQSMNLQKYGQIVRCWKWLLSSGYWMTTKI